MDKKEKLEKIREKMEKDDSLPLKNGANSLVFGEGDPETELMFIGEGPGYWEDKKGRPFVGRAGKFLDKLLQSIELDRNSVFITNVVHHRPPENRDPEEEELKAYGKYLDEMIKAIDPKIIITLGRFSMNKFLPGTKITQIHGKPHKVSLNGKEALVVPMFHPAAGLRNPNFKRSLLEDFEKLPKFLEKADEGKIEQMQLV